MSRLISYKSEPISDASKSLAREIVALIVAREVSYRAAADALEASLELLERESRPVTVCVKK